MDEYIKIKLAFRKAIKHAIRQYRYKVESQFIDSDTRRMWQGLQTDTDYKGKTCHVADTDVLIPDKLNTFFARFKENIGLPTWNTATHDCELSFSMVNI